MVHGIVYFLSTKVVGLEGSLDCIIFQHMVSSPSGPGAYLPALYMWRLQDNSLVFGRRVHVGCSLTQTPANRPVLGKAKLGTGNVPERHPMSKSSEATKVTIYHPPCNQVHWHTLHDFVIQSLLSWQASSLLRLGLNKGS